MVAAAFIIHPSDMLYQGLLLCGVNDAKQQRRSAKTNVRVFKAHFGKDPKHLCRVWRDLQLKGLLDIQDRGRKHSFLGFMAANNYLRCYESLDVMAGRFDLPNNLLGELRWIFIEKIAALKESKVKMPQPEEWELVKLLLSVDGTHARTNEPRDDDMRRNPKNYSYKNNFAGLNYQIALHMWKEQCVYVNAGDPGSTHDMTAMRAEFIGLVPEGGRVVADAGYTGKTEAEKKIFAVGNTFDTKEVKAFKKRARARQESFNKRLKDYKCLANRFTDGVDKHRICFAACVVLVQYAIEDESETGEPLMTI